MNESEMRVANALLKHDMEENPDDPTSGEQNVVKPVEHKCEICGRQFTVPRYMMAHYRMAHQSERVCFVGAQINYPCDVCGEIFLDKQLLKKHKVTHENNYVCRDCDQKFKLKEAFDKHRMSCSASFHCNTCGKKFTEKAQYEEHCFAHVKPPPVKKPKAAKFACGSCSKTFRLRRTLDKHRRTSHKRRSKV